MLLASPNTVELDDGWKLLYSSVESAKSSLARVGILVDD